MQSLPEVSPELPSMGWRLVLALLARLPERALSRSLGRIADVPIPRALRRPILGSFARAAGIDLAEAALPLGAFPTLDAFFVRALRPGARSWPADPSVVASPVDGVVGRFGRVEDGRAIQAKGHDYSLAALLASPAEAERFEGGTFLTIYLSPRHYHRVHTPIAGTIASATYVPGTLFPVNQAAVMHVPSLFARNERLLCYVDGVRGRIAVVAVGAYNVGRIAAAFDPTWSGDGGAIGVTNRRVQSPLSRRYDPPKRVGTGEEIMSFHLGSTVVLLFEPDVELSSDLCPGREVRLGERLAN